MPSSTFIADQCDRHPYAHAYTAWYNAALRAVLTLCGHCAQTHGLALIADGFALEVDDRASLVHNRLEGAL
jgi:hypothetical protein